MPTLPIAFGEPPMPHGSTRGLTAIDRRRCQRTVPMEVLCLGLPRTGTTSLQVALRQLGYGDVYHFMSTFQNPPDCEMWVDALETKYEGEERFSKEQWDQLLGHCMAVTDGPAAYFHAELLATYPHAKVILTTRPVDAWHTSILNTIYRAGEFFYLPTTNPLVHLRRQFTPTTPWFRMVELIFSHCIGHDFIENGRTSFHEHNDAVRTAARLQNRQFLEFDVRDGWGPLCEFLDRKKPDTPFPRVNDAQMFEERIGGMIRRILKRAVVRIGVVVGTLAVLGILARRGRFI